MRLIGLAVVLVVGLTLAPFAASAQQAVKIPRVGVLRPGNPPPDDPGHRYQAKPISVRLPPDRPGDAAVQVKYRANHQPQRREGVRRPHDERIQA